MAGIQDLYRPVSRLSDDRVPLAGILLGRMVTPEHVRALILGGRLPAPTPDDLVPREYLDDLDPDPVPELSSIEWRSHFDREVRRFCDGRSRLVAMTGPHTSRQRERQLSRIGSAAWGVALALTMEKLDVAAGVWFQRAAMCYRRSLADAEPGSWGRCIGSLKALLLADDSRAAERDAQLTLDLVDESHPPSTTARYAATLALLAVHRDDVAERVGTPLVREGSFPSGTATALLSLARRDCASYTAAVTQVLETFETRDRFLEDVPVADTVMTLQALARPRGMEIGLRSSRLP